MPVIEGNARNFQDSLTGSRGDDTIMGLSGNDVIRAGRGNDLIIGGTGSDVMWGGLDADTFQWSAGHITNGAIDYIADFDLRSSDKLNFLSGGAAGNIEILSIEREYVQTENVAAGGTSVNLENNVGLGTDVVFTIRNDLGNTQKIVLLDAWSSTGTLFDLWNQYLDANGWSWGSAVA